MAYGPILAESKDQTDHRSRRDITAALEKALAEALAAAGYEVMNPVRCRMPAQDDQFRAVLAAFAKHFPELKLTA